MLLSVVIPLHVAIALQLADIETTLYLSNGPPGAR
jgi:hypothetical protein